MKAISLFSGMGGDTLGINQSNIQVCAFNDNNKWCIATHLKNFQDCSLIKNNDNSDILKIPDHDFEKYKGEVNLIFAGFPCQGFSNAGKKVDNDPRNTMFKEFHRVSKIIKPEYIIGENVEGLLSRKTTNGETYIDVIKKEFENIGYTIFYKVNHMVKFNIPQVRKRLIIVGIRNDIYQKKFTDKNKVFEFPEELNDGKTNLPNLKNIVKFNMTGAIKIKKEDFDMTSIPSDCILTDNDNQEEEGEYHPYLKLKAKSKDIEYKGKSYPKLLSFSKRDSPIHCEIIDIRKPSKTIICTYDHQPRLFVPLKNKNGYYLRCLLPDELKQIQGFPFDYKISGDKNKQIIQIGNAVPPPLITKVIQYMI